MTRLKCWRKCLFLLYFTNVVLAVAVFFLWLYSVTHLSYKEELSKKIHLSQIMLLRNNRMLCSFLLMSENNKILMIYVDHYKYSSLFPFLIYLQMVYFYFIMIFNMLVIASVPIFVSKRFFPLFPG